jgi:hypothetical protein
MNSSGHWLHADRITNEKARLLAATLVPSTQNTAPSGTHFGTDREIVSIHVS